jgi:phosphoglucomutase
MFDSVTDQQRISPLAGRRFAARPSGTENLYKIYAESFETHSHLESILSEAQRLVGSALRSAGGQR